MTTKRIKGPLREFLQEAEKLGFQFDSHCANGHIRLHNPETGDHSTISFSPSDWRSRKNELARLKRMNRAHQEEAAVPEFVCQQCHGETSALSPREWCAACEGVARELALTANAGSPFDSIRRLREDGTEYWSARDLMGPLGYDKWQNFSRCIFEAMRAAEIVAAQDQFTESSKEIGAGKGAKRHVLDVHLTRYACYMVVMSCDGKKPEVAAGKTYFAVRTRQAEVAAVAPQTREERFALALQDAAEMLAEKDKQIEAAEAINLCLTETIEHDAPLVAKARAHADSDSLIHRQQFAREVQAWGREQGISILHEDVYDFLGRIGLFVRGARSDSGHATAQAEKRGLARTPKGVSENGHAYATGKLTARGQDYAWRRIIKHISEHGSLKPEAVR